MPRLRLTKPKVMEDTGLNNFSLLTALPNLLAAGIVFLIGGIVIWRSPKRALNRVFFLFCVSIAYWGFIDFQFLQAPTPELAFFWLKVGAFWGLAASFLLHFTLIFTGSRLLRHRWSYVLIYGPAVVVAVLWLIPDVLIGPTEAQWGWEFDPHITLTGNLTMTSLGLQAFAVPVLLVAFFLRQKEPKKRTEVSLVLMGFTVPVAIALMEYAAGSFTGLEIPDLTVVSTALGIGGFIGFAIWKYELFPLTPELVAEKIVSHMSDYLFLTDREGRIVTTNQTVLRASGYLKSELEALPLQSILPGVWPQQPVDTADGGGGLKTTVLKTRTGGDIPVQVTHSSVTNRKGDVQGAVFVASDRKGGGLTQNLLRESEERYRSLVEASPEVVYSIDKRGNITSLNPAFEEITGWDRAEWLGKPFQPLLHPDDLPMALKSFQRILYGEVPPRREMRIRSRSGQYLIGEFTSTPLSVEGQVVGEVGVARDITSRKRNEKETLERTQDLALINLLNSGANQGYDLSRLLNLLSIELKKMYSSQASIVYIPSPDGKFLTLHKSTVSDDIAGRVEKIIGFSMSRLDLKIPLEEGGFYLGLIREGKPRLINDPKDIQAMITDYSKSRFIKTLAPTIYHLLEVKSVIAIPFISRHEVIGLLEISRAKLFGEEDLHRLEIVSGELTSILERRRAENELEANAVKVAKAERGFIHAISSMVESRDLYTAGHQHRVAGLARSIGIEMGLPQEQLEGIFTAGYIHDLGKIHVPAEILSKPGQLNPTEMAMVRTHPEVGYDILKEMEFPWPIARIVHEHHERWNGTGYPQGLKSNDICLEARVLCVADVAEAISSHRPYRPALGIDVAVKEIAGQQGVLYDPDAAAACLKLLKKPGFSMEN